MQWIPAASNIRFEVGDRVMVNGNVAKGEGTVFCSHYPEQEANRKGEIIYLFHVYEPFPQIGVRLDNGQDWHFNANDLLEGKITLINRPDVKPELTVGINPFSGVVSISGL